MSRDHVTDPVLEAGAHSLAMERLLDNPAEHGRLEVGLQALLQVHDTPVRLIYIYPEHRPAASPVRPL